MRSARLLICLLLVGGGVGAAALLLPRAVASLRALTVPTLTRPVTPGSPRPSHSKREHRVRRGAHTPRHPAVGDGPDHGPSRAHVKRPTVKAAAINRRGARFSLLTLICIELCAGVLIVLAAALLLVARRTSRRRSRTYALYELHLSTHDQAKAQDLEDMVESIANIVRAWPADRARHGQPYLALELICSTVHAVADNREMEWSINIRCEPTAVTALDGAISAAYPDIRLGRMHGETPRRHPRDAPRARVRKRFARSEALSTR